MGESFFLQNCNLCEIQINTITADELIYYTCIKQLIIYGGYYNEEKIFSYFSCCFCRCNFCGSSGQL